MTVVRTRCALAMSAALLALVGCGSTAQSAPAARSSGASEASEVVATVNGQPITTNEVEQQIAPTLAKLEEEAYQAKRERLDELIANRLLADEAKRRGVTVEALLQQEVTAKTAAVTDADVAAFVDANRGRLPADTAQLTPQIKAYLTSQRESAQRTLFVDGLRARASVDVKLPPPRTFRAAVDTQGFPSRGPATAPVTIVEFSDFHCPYCRAVQPTLQQVVAKYPDKVRIVYRHFPLDSIHPQARHAAEASWCAEQQGKFWQYHDRLYANGPDGSPEALKRMAGEAGLDQAAFDQCVASGRAEAAVEKDVEEGTKFGVTGTPGFFVNGRPMSGALPLSNFVSVIDEELKAAR